LICEKWLRRNPQSPSVEQIFGWMKTFRIPASRHRGAVEGSIGFSLAAAYNLIRMQRLFAPPSTPRVPADTQHTMTFRQPEQSVRAPPC
jgi:hypothetical protein